MGIDVGNAGNKAMPMMMGTGIWWCGLCSSSSSRVNVSRRDREYVKQKQHVSSRSSQSNPPVTMKLRRGSSMAALPRHLHLVLRCTRSSTGEAQESFYNGAGQFQRLINASYA